MVFSSTVFLFIFLPILLFVYFLAAERYRNGVLLIASVFFYAWGEPKTVYLMLFSIVVNYFLGFAVAKDWKWKRVFLASAVVYNLSALFLFKYLNFSVDTLNLFIKNDITIAKIALPIGISFYTFQIMSYVIDVYRGTVKVQRNVMNLALYVSLFPQLIAGPIVRYADVEKQILVRTTSWDKAREGMLRFAKGFSKKVLIADRLCPLADLAFAGTAPSIFMYWLGILAYSLQIYFDFSGYSDMAIGLGKLFGFDFLENFNFPYIAQSIQEFWKRWHISLSSWFKDYLYIPLGGNRKGTMRTYRNLLVVFFLTGLWHGAGMNFIVWGLFYAVFLVLERVGLAKALMRLPRFVRHIYTLLVVMVGWVFFRADGLSEAVHYLKGMVTFSGEDVANMLFSMNGEYWFFLAIGILMSFPHRRIATVFHKKAVTEFVGDIATLAVFMVAICCMVGSGYSPFLYFRF